ncbi:MAG: hypothetical protein JWL63_3219 [Rhodocyclales bacterium]|nr:hypothetical protein [Rhodocyclales bacterium]
MTAAQRIAELARRRALLAVLFFATGKTKSVTSLRGDLETVHGLIASSDQVRNDLIWLREMGMADFAGDMATINERGSDVVRGSAQLPGEG